MGFLVGILFFSHSFAAHKLTNKPITVFLHDGLTKAEMHCKESGQVFLAELNRKPDQTKGSAFSFQCGANDSQTVIKLLEAINEAEKAAQEQKIKNDSQWIKYPGVPVVCRFPRNVAG